MVTGINCEGIAHPHVLHLFCTSKPGAHEFSEYPQVPQKLPSDPTVVSGVPPGAQKTVVLTDALRSP